MGTDDRVTIGCKVDPEVRRQFRMAAAKHDATVSDLLREYIYEMIEADDDLDAQEITPESYPRPTS